jgi:hypothetical protein
MMKGERNNDIITLSPSYYPHASRRTSSNNAALVVVCLQHISFGISVSTKTNGTIIKVFLKINY